MGIDTPAGHRPNRGCPANEVKALSIRQPWAWLIVAGHKDIENRTWRTEFRGEFLVHAGQKFDQDGYEWVSTRMGVAMPRPDEIERGGIVGRARLVDCVSAHPSRWFSGPVGFVLADALPMPFRPLPGKLGFFDVDKKLLDEDDAPRMGAPDPA